MNAEDKARLLELQLRVWAYVARNLLCGENSSDELKDLYTIYEGKIESHGGRIGKAIRLLTDNGDIAYSHKKDSTDCYKIVTFENSKNFTKDPDCFINTWDSLYDRYFNGSRYSYYRSGSRYSYYRSGRYSNNQSENQHDRMFLCGYMDIENITDDQVLSIYWNKDLYDISGSEVYPKAQQETRIKGILRAIIEHDLCVSGFRNKMETRLGLDKDTLPADSRESVSYRNCGFTLANMTQSGLTSYIDEYEFWVKYFTKLRDNTQALYKSIWQAGGSEVAVKEMRQETIKTLLYRAPIDSVKTSNDSDYSQEDAKSIALFILRNASYWEYETLYGSDPSVTHCTDRDTVPHFEDEFKMPTQAGKLLGIEVPKDEEDVHV